MGEKWMGKTMGQNWVFLFWRFWKNHSDRRASYCCVVTEVSVTVLGNTNNYNGVRVSSRYSYKRVSNCGAGVLAGRLTTVIAPAVLSAIGVTDMLATAVADMLATAVRGKQSSHPSDRSVWNRSIRRVSNRCDKRASNCSERHDSNRSDICASNCRDTVEIGSPI